MFQLPFLKIWELCQRLWKLLSAVKNLTAFTSWPQFWQFCFVGVNQRSDWQGKAMMGPDENTSNTKYLRENGEQHCKATKIRKWKWLFPQGERRSNKIFNVTFSLSLISKCKSLDICRIEIPEVQNTWEKMEDKDTRNTKYPKENRGQETSCTKYLTENWGQGYKKYKREWRTWIQEIQNTWERMEDNSNHWLTNERVALAWTGTLNTMYLGNIC